MTFVNEPADRQDCRYIDADQVQAIMPQVNEHLRVEMKCSRAVQQDRVN